MPDEYRVAIVAYCFLLACTSPIWVTWMLGVRELIRTAKKRTMDKQLIRQLRRARRALWREYRYYVRNSHHSLLPDTLRRIDVLTDRIHREEGRDGMAD